VPTQVAITTAMITMSSSRAVAKSLVAMIAIAQPMSRTPQAPMPTSARRRPVTPRAP
jgi:hypothetical protein